ncbi:MAG: helix-turn-helix domain-containing protein [Faecousia sp.]
MEETLGKRISGHRKRLGLTQDRLAELLGITAQAVSKWENDQSCPDITMLPRLAEVFGISTDELLGLEKKEVHIAELVTDQKPEDDTQEPEGLHMKGGDWELHWDGSRKTSLGFALWILLFGGLLLLANLQNRNIFWDLLWTTGLLVFGLFGLYPKFSCFRLGCALFSGYFLLSNFELLPFPIGKKVLLPVLLLLFGLSLLVDALRKPQRGSFHVNHNGKSVINRSSDSCEYDGEHFCCGTCFGGNYHLIQLPRLSGGSAEVSFGELTVDLGGCEEIADGCQIDLDCSFGELELRLPRECRAEPVSSTAFASVEVKGSPDPEASIRVNLNCDASFGQITIRYL